MNNKLIVDVGMHKGEDTAFYLKKGFNVIAIDADPKLVKENQIKFKNQIDSGQLLILNNAISDKEEIISFNISEQSLWNSLKSEISNRHSLLKDTILVQAKTLGSIFNEYGVPVYCKIDIEGYDAICLKTLANNSELPSYISVESECADDFNKLSDDQALETLLELKNLGYTKFQLIDQKTLISLKLNEGFYGFTIYEKIKNRINKNLINNKLYNKEKLSIKYDYKFPDGASGPFGKDLEGEWYNFEKAKQLLLKHRNDFFMNNNLQNYSFWCDWHAKMS